MYSLLRLITIAAACTIGAACVDTDRPQDDVGYQATEVAPQAQVVDTVPATPRRRVMIGTADVTNIGYDRGNPNAPVVMINFSDFGCPYCASFSLQTYPELEREFVATGKVYYKHVPFVMGMFPNGQQAARASECAADQGKFWPMHDRIYATQRDWKRARDPWVPLVNAAVGAGLDTTAFRRCFNDHRTEPRTRRASNIASDLGVRATPSFVVNGRPIEGALPLAEFRRILDAAVREATQGR